MFNLPSYYNTIKKYKKNKADFETIKKDIETYIDNMTLDK